MASKILVNIGSGNGLVPDGTKPLPEPMLTYHHASGIYPSGPLVHHKSYVYLNTQDMKPQIVFAIYKFKSQLHLPGDKWVKDPTAYMFLFF